MTMKETIELLFKNVEQFREDHPDSPSFAQLRNMNEDEYPPEVLALMNSIFPEMPNGPYKIDLIEKMIERLTKPDDTVGTLIEIFDGEIEFLKSLETTEEKKIFYCLLIHQKLHPHKSGWIKFNKEDVLGILYADKEIQEAKSEIFSCLVKYGLQFSVVGSNDPVPCYNLPQFECGRVLYSFPHRYSNSKEIFKEIMKNA